MQQQILPTQCVKCKKQGDLIATKCGCLYHTQCCEGVCILHLCPIEPGKIKAIKISNQKKSKMALYHRIVRANIKGVLITDILKTHPNAIDHLKQLLIQKMIYITPSGDAAYDIHLLF